jgi:cob(I)alamin adenosyltransferase
MGVITKAGDKGKSRYVTESGQVAETEKDNEVFEAVGTIDELMAVAAIAADRSGKGEIAKKINRMLVAISGRIAGGVEVPNLENETARMEEEIGRVEKELGEEKRFLEAGVETEQWWNWARTVARRTERRVVALSRIRKVDEAILAYFNRLSDYLFIISRQSKY